MSIEHKVMNPGLETGAGYATTELQFPSLVLEQLPPSQNVGLAAVVREGGGEGHKLGAVAQRYWANLLTSGKVG